MEIYKFNGCFFRFLLSSCSNHQEVSEGTKTSKIIKEEYKIPQEDETLFLLHKSVNTKKQYTSDEIILFLEPFSVPTAEAFDVSKYSWMDEYAKKDMIRGQWILEDLGNLQGQKKCQKRLT